MSRERIKYLEGLIPKDRAEEIEKKYRENFNKYARYMGNGVYGWKGLFTSDPQELYLMGVLSCENIKFKQV